MCVLLSIDLYLYLHLQWIQRDLLQRHNYRCTSCTFTYNFHLGTHYRTSHNIRQKAGRTDRHTDGRTNGCDPSIPLESIYSQAIFPSTFEKYLSKLKALVWETQMEGAKMMSRHQNTLILSIDYNLKVLAFKRFPQFSFYIHPSKAIYYNAFRENAITSIVHQH